MRKLVNTGLAVVMTGALLAGCGSGGEARSTTTTPHNVTTLDPGKIPMVPMTPSTGMNTENALLPPGHLGPAPCLVLEGLRALLGKPGSPAISLFGEGVNISGSINVSGSDLRAAAKVLAAVLEEDKAANTVGQADGFAAYATTIVAADEVQRLLETPIGPDLVWAQDHLVDPVLNQARENVADALDACSPGTFTGDNFSRANP
jgi:hypothetical protein